MWLPRTAVSVDHFHKTMVANDMLIAVRQGLSSMSGPARPGHGPGRRTGYCCSRQTRTSPNADSAG
ncbi:hypothetical protein [Arthrobacter cavernae]